jgi:hypothetical protein
VPKPRRLAIVALCASLALVDGASATGRVRAAGSITGDVVVNPLGASLSLTATQVSRGQPFGADGVVRNQGDSRLLDVRLDLRADAQLVVDGASRLVPELAGGGVHQERWTVCGSLSGSYLLLMAGAATGAGGRAFTVESPAVLVVVLPSAMPCGGFPFGGFFSPIDNPPVVNLATAGSAIPVKFSLGGDRGLDILAPGSPESGQIRCDTSAPIDAIEQTVNPGSSSLSYDSRTGVYTYVWKTKKPWAGTCRQLTLTLTDGSVHPAQFKFRS